MRCKPHDPKILWFIGRIVDSTEYRPKLDEREIATMGPMAIGHYGELVVRNFLRSNGVFPKAQFPYKDCNGLRHRTDFLDTRAKIAYEVKTGNFKSGSIYEFKPESLEYALSSRQFRRVVFVNVGFLGRVGFSEPVRKRLRKFGTITLC